MDSVESIRSHEHEELRPFSRTATSTALREDKFDVENKAAETINDDMAGLTSFGISVFTMLLLSLLLVGFTQFSSGLRSVLVKYNETVTFSCSCQDSGLVTWTMPKKGGITVAWCNQTLCKSEKGFEISYDQYLKGHQVLTITQADFSKRTWYTCKCDDQKTCYFSLRIETVNLPLHIQPGESLNLDLPISEDVDVFLNWTENGRMKSTRLCGVNGRLFQCEDEYKDQVSFSSRMTLDEVKNGTYIIKDRDNDEVIIRYPVTVNGVTKASSKTISPPTGEQSNQDRYIMIGVIVLVVVLLLIAIVVIVVLFRKNKRLQKCLRNKQNGEIPLTDVNVGSPVMDTEGLGITDQKTPQCDQDDESDVEEPLLGERINLPINPHPFIEEPVTNVVEANDGHVNVQQTSISDEPHHLLESDSVELPQPVNEPEPSISVAESCSEVPTERDILYE